jgi:aminopeptidase YwaD
VVAAFETRKKGTNIATVNKLMKKGFWIYFALWLTSPALGQKLRKADKALAASIAVDIAGLGGDSSAAGQHIPPVCLFTAAQFERMGMDREGDTNSYLKLIKLDRGMEIGGKCALSLDGKAVVVGQDFYPLAGSPNGHTEGSSGVSLNERGLPWIYDLRYDLETGKGAVPVNLYALLEKKSLEAKKKGATALLLYNSSKIADGLFFDVNDRSSVYAIPVVYIDKSLSSKVFKDATAYVDVDLTVATEEKDDYVHNVEGFINNGAHRTVILRASLDTAGCGAALIELARLVKQAGWKRHNYLVLGYSGGLTEISNRRTVHPDGGLDSVDYRVDVGRIVPDPANPVLMVSGFSASGKWEAVFNGVKDNYLHMRYVNGGEVMAEGIPFKAGFPSFGMTVVGPPTGQEENYDREALAVRYIFKLMEAAEKQ